MNLIFQIPFRVPEFSILSQLFWAVDWLGRDTDCGILASATVPSGRPLRMTSYGFPIFGHFCCWKDLEIVSYYSINKQTWIYYIKYIVINMENKDPVFLITFFIKDQLLVSVHKALWTDFTLTFKYNALYLITGGSFVVYYYFYCCWH